MTINSYLRIVTIVLQLLGGWGGSSYLSASEIFVNGAFTAGPELPVSVSDHCMIYINETHSMFTGGGGGGTNVSDVCKEYVCLFLHFLPSLGTSLYV